MHFTPEVSKMKLPLDSARFESAKGSWLIAVESVAETLAGRSLLIGIVLEQKLDEENMQTRRLELVADRAAAREPENCAGLIERICAWVESTEGDGFLDLTVG